MQLIRNLTDRMTWEEVKAIVAWLLIVLLAGYAETLAELICG